MSDQTKKPETKILTPEAAAQAAVSLPEAGFARDEELKQRADVLAEAIETETPEAYRIDPSKIDIEREIAALIDRNELEVEHRQPGFRYCWVNFSQHGKMVMSKKREGWEVVAGNMPEAPELKFVDGTRHLGDVLLMRITEERAQILDLVDKYRRQRQQEGIISNLQSMADQTRGGIVLHENDRMTEVAARRAAIQQQAFAGVDKMIREGSVPGLPQYQR